MGEIGIMHWGTKKRQLEAELEHQHEALRELGDRCLASEKHTLAQQCFQAACSLLPQQAVPYLRLGTLAAREGDFEEAQRCFETVVRLDAECAEAYGGLAMIHQQRREFSAAFEMYLKCLERDLDNLVALLGLFQTSCQMGTFEKIIHFLEIYLAKHPDDVSVMFCLASLYVKEGDLSRAQGFLRQVLVLEPGKVQASELLEKVEAELWAARAGSSARERQEMPSCQTEVMPLTIRGNF